jgi:TonB family protein
MLAALLGDGMWFHPARHVGLALGAMVWLAAMGGMAQDGDRPSEQEPGAELTPPSLVRFVEADYPEEAAEHGEDAVVELELTVDREGRITGVRVVESAGEAFDAAAVEAARGFRFEPARRGGEPVPAVIRYRYTFELRGGPDADDHTALTALGVLSGRLVSRADGEAVARARVAIASEDDEEEARATTTDDGGRFTFDGLPAGAYAVRVEAEGFVGVESTEEVHPGEATEVLYRMDAEDADGDGDGGDDTFGATAVVQAPPREVTRRSIGKEELTRIPGTRGDALRAVELLPGVGRPPFTAGLLIVRGSAPGDSEVFFDGTTIPLLFHFGGITSAVNSRLIDQIDFYPGNFSARYGRKVGGILEVRGRDPATDGFHGVADLNVLDMSVLAEGPVGDKASVAVAARRSHIDLVFDQFVPSDALDVVAAPVYWDYQAFASWRPTSRDRFLFKVYGSSDRFEVNLPEPSDEDPAIRGNVDLATQFHYAQAGWERKLSQDVDQKLDLRIGTTRANFALGQDLSFDGNFFDVYGRAEWQAQAAPRVQLIWGTDILYVPFRAQFVGPPPRQTEGADQGNLSGQDLVDLSVSGAAFQPAAYVESILQPVDPLRIIMGMRLDYYDEIQKLSADPRLVAIYSVTDSTRIKGGVGLFSQPPSFVESLQGIGNPDLTPMRSIHVSTGVEQDLGEHLRVEVEGFYKRLWDRPVETRGGVPPRFINGGIGRIYGMEVMGRLQPSRTLPLFGYLSYTLSRSERLDGHGDPWRLFDFDQTHIFAMAAVYKLPKGWEVGATVRLVSGNPTTPIVGGIYDARELIYRPVFGAPNSVRNPMFNRLDARVEKKWDFDAWKLAVYLDVQNVYNARNPEGRIYNFDFSEERSLRGLPILPSLGIRGEM